MEIPEEYDIMNHHILANQSIEVNKSFVDFKGQLSDQEKSRFKFLENQSQWKIKSRLQKKEELRKEILAEERERQ